MANNGPRSLEEIENSEHLDPLTTGDNISAKKVAPYAWDGVNWQRVPLNPGQLIPVAYDSLTYTATSGTVDTFKYYTGGTGGTLVATLTVTYVDSTHATLVSVVRT